MLHSSALGRCPPFYCADTVLEGPGTRARAPEDGDKKKRPGWGEPGRATLMRQFGGRFGGTRVTLQMVNCLSAFKGISKIFLENH